MARFIHWSDLHTEFDPGNMIPFEMPDLPKDIDALLLAGDTGVGDGHLDFLQKAWEKYEIPIISVWGNHEVYKNNYTLLRKREAARLLELRASGMDIRVLHGEAAQVSGVTVIGASMWTDFSLYVGMEFQAKQIANQQMNDFHMIRIGERARHLTPNDMADLYAEDKARVTGLLEEHKDDVRVVMTHYMPSEACIHPTYRGDLLNASFATNLEPLIWDQGPNFWIFGHTHQGLETDIDTPQGTTRLRHNPRGYPHEKSAFNPHRIIDTDDPERKFL